MEENYLDSEAYQKEIAEQYAKRVKVFPIEEVRRVLSLLGMPVDVSEIKEAAAGNMHATYVTDDLVIKMNQDRSEADYYSNIFVSSRLFPTYPVVEVLTYDFFEKTDYEVLVMRRARGVLLQQDMPDLDAPVLETVFRQVLKVVNAMNGLSFNDFGSLDGVRAFTSYPDYLIFTFDQNAKQIREKKLVPEDGLATIEQYFKNHLDVFKNEKAVFVHTDLHMGNILHDGATLTAVIDFDAAVKGPAALALRPLVAVIDDPAQFVEGTPEFARYKKKRFPNLLPLLREELPDIFSDPLLLQKLNLISIREGIDLIAANWSAGLNEILFRLLLDNEVDDTKLNSSYYGRMLHLE